MVWWEKMEAENQLFFNLILGEELADRGDIQIPKNYVIGTLRQDLVFQKDSILEEVITGLRKDQEDQFYKAEKILLGLGFVEADFIKDPYSFSGGYQN